MRRLPKNSDAMKLTRIFQVPTKTGPFSAGVNLWIVLELLHLKMEVTVSELCDVIRVKENNVIVYFATCLLRHTGLRPSSICTDLKPVYQSRAFDSHQSSPN